MERGLILLAVAFVVCVSQGVQGAGFLSFSNDTKVNISRDGCGVSKLCRAMPADCDPTGQGGCLFASASASAPVAPSGFELSVELRGNSSGYVALGLTANASVGTSMLFICAANSSTGSFFFRTMERNNTNASAPLTALETMVREIRGMVNGSVIKCEFTIPNLNGTNTRTSHVTTFSVLLGTGTVMGNGVGPFSLSLDTGPLNLRDTGNATMPTMPPTNATMTNATMTNATMPTNATMSTTVGKPNSGAAVQPHAVLLLSVLALSAMLRA